MLNSVATTARAITPSDTIDFPNRECRGLWVGGAGVVRVQMAKNDPATVDFTVGAGTLLPIQVIRVYATGTTATLIIALY